MASQAQKAANRRKACGATAPLPALVATDQTQPWRAVNYENYQTNPIPPAAQPAAAMTDPPQPGLPSIMKITKRTQFRRPSSRPLR